MITIIVPRSPKIVVYIEASAPTQPVEMWVAKTVAQYVEATCGIPADRLNVRIATDGSTLVQVEGADSPEQREAIFWTVTEGTPSWGSQIGDTILRHYAPGCRPTLMLPPFDVDAWLAGLHAAEQADAAAWYSEAELP